MIRVLFLKLEKEDFLRLTVCRMTSYTLDYRLAARVK